MCSLAVIQFAQYLAVHLEIRFLLLTSMRAVLRRDVFDSDHAMQAISDAPGRGSMLVRALIGFHIGLGFQSARLAAPPIAMSLISIAAVRAHVGCRSCSLFQVVANPIH